MGSGIICVICDNKPFCHTDYLKKHIKLVHDQITKCEFCGKSYDTLSDKKKHIESVHQKFNCDLCNEKFSTLSAQKGHMGDVHQRFFAF